MEIESLLKDLIKIESITPKDEGCFDLIEPFLKDLGFKCERIDYDNVENLYAVLGNEGPLMCFLGHTDVVPTGPVENWSQPPFSAVTIDGHMYGRGTADMKGNIAAYLLALKDFLSTNPTLNYRLAVLLTSNEEGEPEDGKIDVIIKKFMDDGEHIDFCLVGEPSSNKKVGDTIRIGRRGSLSGTLKVLGKQGHVAYPEWTLNPINPLTSILNTLCNLELDKGTEDFPPSNMEIVKIESSEGATNIVPQTSTGIFNIRYNINHTKESLQSMINEVVSKNINNSDYKVDITFNNSAEPFLTEKGKFTEIVKSSVDEITGMNSSLTTTGGTSDARFFKDYCEVAEFGLIGETAHQIDENVNTEDITKLKEIYSLIITKYFQ